MRSIKNMYQRASRKYPIGTQAVQAGSVINGILMGIGDQIAQNLIEADSKNIDIARTMQFTGIGFFIVGPATRTWYGLLDKFIGSRGYSTVIKKVACDQALFAPTFIAVLLAVIGICQGKDTEGIKRKLANEYRDILTNNYKLWPMVQLVNFWLVPLNHQALVVQSVALSWNSYISYRTSQNRHDDITNGKIPK